MNEVKSGDQAFFEMKSIDWACGKWSKNWSCYRCQWCLVGTGNRNREHIGHDSICLLREAVRGWKFPPEAELFFPDLVARRRACFLTREFGIKSYGVSLYSNACFQTYKRWRFDKSVFWELNIWQIYVCHGCHDVRGVCGEDRQVGHNARGCGGGAREWRKMKLTQYKLIMQQLIVHRHDLTSSFPCCLSWIILVFSRKFKNDIFSTNWFNVFWHFLIRVGLSPYCTESWAR